MFYVFFLQFQSARHKHVRLFRTDQNYPVDQNYIIIMNNESDFRHIQALQKHQYFPRTLAVLRESLNCNQTLDIDIRIDHELYIYCPLAKKVVEQYTVNDIVK